MITIIADGSQIAIIADQIIIYLWARIWIYGLDVVYISKYENI